MRLFDKMIVAVFVTAMPAVVVAQPAGTQPTDAQPADAQPADAQPAATPATPATPAPTPEPPLYEPPATEPVLQDATASTPRASAIHYAQQGVVELGGSAGLTLASNLRDVNFSPSIGYFVGDNFEVSGILSVSNVKAGNESSTVWSALAEPSFHFQMSNDLYAFVGVGLGAAYIDPLGTALAIAPRAGMNFLVGKSGVLTPSLSYEYTMHDTMTAKGADGTTDVTLLAVSSTLRANIGYAVMW